MAKNATGDRGPAAPAKGLKPLVKPLDPFVLTREAAHLMGISEETTRELGDSGAIECVRDSNNQRRYSRDSIARYMAMKQQTAAAKIYRKSQEDMARRVAEARKNVRRET